MSTRRARIKVNTSTATPVATKPPSVTLSPKMMSMISRTANLDKKRIENIVTSLRIRHLDPSRRLNQSPTRCSSRVIASINSFRTTAVKMVMMNDSVMTLGAYSTNRPRTTM